MPSFYDKDIYILGLEDRWALRRGTFCFELLRPKQRFQSTWLLLIALIQIKAFSSFSGYLICSILLLRIVVIKIEVKNMVVVGGPV